MKQYLTTELTSKLIELGFDKPRSVCKVELDLDMGTIPTWGYSVGDLIEMLPPIIENNNGIRYILSITHDTVRWIVDYSDYEVMMSYRVTNGKELIDALFDMVVKLKEDGVI